MFITLGQHLLRMLNSYLFRNLHNSDLGIDTEFI